MLFRSEMPHRLEGGTLIALFEGVRLRDAGQQSDGKRKNVFLAISERILRPSQRALEQPAVAEEMRFPGFLYLKPIVLDNRVDRQPDRLIWQGRLEFLETAP